MTMLQTEFEARQPKAGGLKKLVRSTLRMVEAGLDQCLRPVKVFSGRIRYLSPMPRRFTGAYSSFEEALTAAHKAGRLAGYNHQEVAPVSFEAMCKLGPFDYPVLFWLMRLRAQADGLLDAGGHMGTKFRAFRSLLDLPKDYRWVIYELPEIAKAGRQRALEEGISQLTFIDDLTHAPALPVFLASGLLQYLDRPLSQLLLELEHLPPHLILNKVAFQRDNRPVVTLERIGRAYVPYQRRNENAFVTELEALGYEQVDRWSIPQLSHVIDTHPELGASESAGFYFRLREMKT